MTDTNEMNGAAGAGVPTPLPAEALRRVCDPATIPYATTREAAPHEGVVGQDRAVAAIEFGIGIRRDGYNLFALGPPGTGKHTLVIDFLQRAAAEQPTPPDYVYVNNFANAHEPRTIQLPPGRGAELHTAIEQLIGELRTGLPAAFEADEYRSRRQMIEDEFKRRQEEMFEGLQKQAREKGVALMRTPVGLIFAPVKDGQVIEPKDFEELPEDEQARLKTEIEAMQQELQTAMEQVPGWDKEHREKIRDLNKQVSTFAVGHLIAILRRDFADCEAVIEYLDQLEADVVENAFDFIRTAMAQEAGAAAADGNNQALQDIRAGDDAAAFRRYKVNVVIDNGATEGAPVVHEDLPLLGNLLGRIEHTARFGTLMTDFNLIKAGSLHRANGGYLIIDARRLLLQPMAWEELKRSLRSRLIRIESMGQLANVVTTTSLDPEPIPLDVKVVLVGDRQLYQLLLAHDPDFEGLFKVQAEFESRMERDR